METKKQKEANSRWKRKHRRQNRIYSYRSTARLFIKKYADLKDIKEFKTLLNIREHQLLNK